MLRPWWFIEYSPKEQKVFDILHKTIEATFAQYGYQHIHTPAVESVDVLKKWWDEVSKQIFGLYGLAQWSQDAKDYALHFDLTVPFARYVLDRQNELAFPFKRYQIQPVWRGERSQKGRYKEFRQADIDVIWKTKDDRWYNPVYDADCIVTLARTLRQIIDRIGVTASVIVRYNNKAFMVDICTRLGITNTAELFALLDKYYKLPKVDFDTKLAALLTPEQLQEFIKVRDLESYADDFPEIQTYIKPLTDKIRPGIQGLTGIEIVYDPRIVRGLDYYTGTVFETFIDDRKELGSVCSWWAYANLSEFLDPKQSFSGIGGSIGLSRLMSVLLEDYKIMETFISQEESYLVIHEEKTSQQAQDIVASLRTQHKIAELYPLPDKLDKQFKYAEKKGITYIVQIFDTWIKYKTLWWQRIEFDSK
jgi:histidyl-tRNA synthetase